MKLLRKNWHILVLFGICILALFLRFFLLSEYPVGFHIDEGSLGYNGYSLLVTGRDDNGKPWPLYIDMFGDNRPSGYHYLTILPIVLFGLTEFATRFPAALFGAFSILPFYFLTFSLFKQKSVSLLAALLLALSPWHIVLSRASGEAVVALFFIIVGFAFIFTGFLHKKSYGFVLGGISLVVSFFFYHSPRLFVPLLFFVIGAFLFPLWRAYRRSLQVLLVFVFCGICLVAFSLIFLITGGTGRFSQVNIFNNFETKFFILRDIQQDAISGAPFIESRFFHNKITNVALVFLKNYGEYFTTNFLFISGGLPIWYRIPRVGLMYLLLAPFLLYGIFVLAQNKTPHQKIPLLWLLIAPIVPAITMDDVPNINRAVVMVPALEMIAAVGIVTFLFRLSGIKRTIGSIVFAALLLSNGGYFFHQYFFNAKVHDPWYRNNGFAKMMQYVNKRYHDYDAIVLSKYQGGIYPLVLFYSKYNPQFYQQEGSPKDKDYGGFGKFVFVPQDCPSVQRNNRLPKVSRMLFIDKGDCPFEKVLKTRKFFFIEREDDSKAFRIVYE